MARTGGPADRPDLTYAEMATPEGLARVRAYTGWIGVDTAMIEPEPGAPTGLIGDAHAAGLKVAAWTFRAENAFLPEGDRVGDDPAGHGRITGRVARFAGYGLDAAFMDQPRYRPSPLGGEGRSAVDLSEVGDAAHDSTDLTQQFQTVVAFGHHVRVDHDLLEEGVHRRAEAG